MSDVDPDYTEYSLEQLLNARRSVGRGKDPARTQRIEAEIQKRLDGLRRDQKKYGELELPGVRNGELQALSRRPGIDRALMERLRKLSEDDDAAVDFKLDELQAMLDAIDLQESQFPAERFPEVRKRILGAFDWSIEGASLYRPSSFPACAAAIGLYVALFVVMSAAGGRWWRPSPLDIIDWGANLGPLVLDGEWWRLFTCTVMHRDVPHLLLIVLFLWIAGAIFERFVGGAGTLAILYVAGLGGSLAHLVWDPFIPAAGASGAVYGIYGAMGGVALAQKRSFLGRELAPVAGSLAGAIGASIVLQGVTETGIDNSGHVGGFVAGFLGGVFLGARWGVSGVKGRRLRPLLLASAGTLATWGVWAILSSIPSEVSSYAHFWTASAADNRLLKELETKSRRPYDGAYTRIHFADYMSKEYLPQSKAVWLTLQDRTDELPYDSQYRLLILSTQRYVGALDLAVRTIAAGATAGSDETARRGWERFKEALLEKVVMIRLATEAVDRPIWSTWDARTWHAEPWESENDRTSPAVRNRASDESTSSVAAEER